MLVNVKNVKQSAGTEAKQTLHNGAVLLAHPVDHHNGRHDRISLNTVPVKRDYITYLGFV